MRQSDGRRLFAAFDVVLSSVVSRKTHGGAGDFDVNLPLTGKRGVECRAPGQTGTAGVEYKVIFTFPNIVNSVGSVSATANGNTVPSSGSIDVTDPHKYVVNLSAVPNAQYVTVTLGNVHDAASHVGDVSATMGVLIGDVNASGVVTSGDTNLSKAQALQPVTNSNFRNDINASGAITTGDVNIIKQNALSQLPTPP